MIKPFKYWSKKLENKLLDKNIKPSQIYTLTKNIDQHPEEWNGPCDCRLCQSYGD